MLSSYQGGELFFHMSARVAGRAIDGSVFADEGYR